MNIPTKRLKSGFEVPSLAFGTWQMGGRFERAKDYDETRDIMAIQKAVEHGMTRFDTAESYGDGLAEEILGRALQGVDRPRLFITSKVSKWNLAYDQVLRSAEASLKRLGMEYLDLYLIHAPSQDIPMEETLRAFDRLHEQGLIKHLGVSNFNTARLSRACELTAHPIVLNQVHYNLVCREAVHDGLLAYCQERDMFLEGWRPVQKGALAREGVTIMDELCRKYKKTPAQIAINWLLSQKNVLTLFKASSMEHLEENLGAIGWELSVEDIERLAEEFPGQIKQSDVVRLG